MTAMLTVFTIVIFALVAVAALSVYLGHVKASLAIQEAAAEADFKRKYEGFNAALLVELHKAEAAGKLAEGTFKAFVDAQIARVKTETAAIRARL